MHIVANAPGQRQVFGIGKRQGDHGKYEANYRCCLPALAGFVSPHSVGPDTRNVPLGQARLKAIDRALAKPTWNDVGRPSVSWLSSVGLLFMNPFIITFIAAGLLVGCTISSSQHASTATVDPPAVSIHQAAWKGDVRAIEQHCDAGTDVNLRNNWNATPLHYATRSGQTAAANLLVAKGANVDAKNNEGVTPLHYSASGGHWAIVALLIANGAKVNEQDSEGLTPLHRAARGGQWQTIDLLVANGAEVNAKNTAGLTPLELADEKAAEVLRGHGGKSAVKLGALSDDAANGKIEAVKRHLAAGANVNGKDDLGRTPLYRAAYNGHTEIAVLLLDGGADADVRDANGWTPLHGAAYKGHLEIVAALLAKKAAVNAKDVDGDTPLDWAKNKPEIAALLRKDGGKTGEELKAEGK